MARLRASARRCDRDRPPGSIGRARHGDIRRVLTRPAVRAKISESVAIAADAAPAGVVPGPARCLVGTTLHAWLLEQICQTPCWPRERSGSRGHCTSIQYTRAITPPRVLARSAGSPEESTTLALDGGEIAVTASEPEWKLLETWAIRPSRRGMTPGLASGGAAVRRRKSAKEGASPTGARPSRHQDHHRWWQTRLDEQHRS